MNHQLFLSYIEAAGAELLDVKNEWEVARFKTKNGTSVVYKTKKGNYSFNGRDAEEAYKAFNKKAEWVPSVINRTPAKTNREKLIQRDGLICFYCMKPFENDKEITVEHLLSISHGGSNHINNLTLACKTCNVMAGNLPLVEKIKIREKNLLTPITCSV